MEDIKNIVRDPLAEAVLRKLTGPAESQKRGMRPEGGSTPMRTELASLTSSRIRATRNAQRIYEALPEMDTIVTIATSSLLSTKDLINATLLYECTDAEVPLNIRTAVLEIVRDYMDNTRKLPKKLYGWVYDAMRTRGASPVMIMSDSGFDNTFGLAKVAGESNRTESIKTAIRAAISDVSKQLGILGPIRSETNERTNDPVVALERMISGGGTRSAPQEMSIELGTALVAELNFAKDLIGCEAKIDKKEPLKLNARLSEKMSIKFTDNPNILRLPELARRVARESGRASLYGNMEMQAYERPDGNLTSNPTPTPQGGDAIQRERVKLTDLNPNADTTKPYQPYAEIPKLDFGQANHLDYVETLLPAASTIPVVMGSDVRNPIGWITLVDDLGNFVNCNSTMYGDVNFYNYMTDSGMADSTINRSYVGMGGSNVVPEIANRISSRFGEIAEDYFTQNLGEALGGAELEIPMSEAFVNVLLTRHLAGRHTQVLYIPAENVAYFATNFNEDGFGVSLPERSFVISTVRMALLFAYMNASVLNASRFMQYDITLSPDDANAQETVDRLKSDILNGFNRRQPLWGDMNDAWAMASNANIAFNVEGNQYYSGHKVAVSDTTPEYKAPDMEFDKELIGRTARLANVDPDLVLSPENIEFASQIYSKSLIVTAQIQSTQEQLSIPLSRYAISGCMASPKLQAKILEAIIAETGDGGSEGDSSSKIAEANGYMQRVIRNLKVTIPPPDTSAAASQMELFDKRIEYIDKLVDNIITSDMVTKLNEHGLKYDVDQLKDMCKAYYVRTWLRRQGMETDLIDMFTDKDGQSDMVKAITDDAKNIAEFLARVANRADSKIDTVVKGLVDENAAGSVDLPDDQSGTGGDDLGGGDGGLGDDDLDALGGDGDNQDNDMVDTGNGDEDQIVDDENADTNGATDDENANGDADKQAEDDLDQLV